MKDLILIISGCFVIMGNLRSQGSADTSSYTLTRLAINSNRSDYSPYLLNKKLYFSSGRIHRYGLVYYDADTTKELEDVFYAEQLDSVTFGHVHYFTEKVNSKFNDGPLCFNKNGTTLYITGNDIKRITKQVEPLDIFVSHKVNGHWEQPVALPFCKGTYSYCHPALLPNDRTIVFSSDMPGGFGGMDLYTSVFENGTWSDPKNMGAVINSSANEVFPFVNSAGNLYFSSNKSGNLDIYTTDAGFASLTKLSGPFNGPTDDFGVWMDSSGTWGYFSSDREGNDNIYYYKSNYPVFDNCSDQRTPSYCYSFFEEATAQSEDTLGMTYEWDLGDGTKMRGLEVKHCYARPGNYSVQLNIVDKASGALFYNELSYDFTVEETKQLYIESADTIPLGKEVSFGSGRSQIPGYKLGDRFWFLDEKILGKGMDAKHTFSKEGVYYLRLGVLARNDSIGKIEKFCTQKRVLVKDSAWISANRSITKVVWPPPRKEKPSGTKEGEDVNFRVHLGSSNEDIPVNSAVFSDLKDVRKTKTREKYVYTSGHVKKITDAIPYYRSARKKGFESAVVIAFKKDSLLPGQEKAMKGNIPAQPIITVTVDTSKVLSSVNVYFDFNRARFGKEYEPALDSVCKKLKGDRKLELIILAVSDTVGSDTYNLKLSKRRAANVQQYLRRHGVGEKRLEAISLGENLPAEYETRKNRLLSNRRVEIIIVKNGK